MSVNTSEQDQFHRVVQTLSDVFGPSSGIDSDDVDPYEIVRIMSAYISNETEWSKYALCDPRIPYTKNLVDEGNGKSNLLLIVWNPARGSPIHDHANAHCVMKLLKGSLTEFVYEASREPGQAPRLLSETVYRENEVTYISDKIGIHKISNPSQTEMAVSLHLYTPPHAANYGFNIISEENGHAVHYPPSGFYSERGLKMEDKDKNSGSTSKLGSSGEARL